ncbi:hypothetical protein Zmor_023351 [Zophobas morio]|uniref:Protein quiver n=1 Tax=Zophobas morio TaxID=2755281 RepID=A0AA38M7S8_9CUCU|nr:hypothetical protein Zmor_023351 [Zophobas morio]
MACVARIVILSFLALTLNVNSALSLNCYKCTGPLNIGMDCENNLEHIPVIPCEGGEVCAEYVIGNPGIEILDRGCYPNNQCDILNNQHINNPVVAVVRCTTCDSDSCNSANLLTVSVFLSFLTLFLFYL